MKQDIKKEIEKAERSEGYVILISRINNKKLTHSHFRRTFELADIKIALDKYWSDIITAQKNKLK